MFTNTMTEKTAQATDTVGAAGAAGVAGVRRAALTAGVVLAALTGLLTLPAQAAVPTVRSAVTAAGATTLGACGPGQLCLWPKTEFKGRAQAHELAALDIESCVALPAGTSAQSLANRTGRPVTTYQSAECAETGEFETYPGKGVWVPQSPYQVRAFKIWER
ncbi:peptidase inhibitor family I36 protein [Streptomyces sp. NPDC090025]|uniref:peptidase inhibitor family I36 protein n=1 Tax=Streptomyces sp. NPDC090025 TaxID=3365922 RepID=UPI003837B91B